MRIIILLLLVMLAASGAACGDFEQALSPVSTAELEGTTWFLLSYGSASSPKTALDSVQVSVSFDNYEDLHGFVGCNYFGKHFEIEELKLITDELQRTRFSCPEDEVMVQDAAVMSALQTISTIGLDEDILVIGYETGELRFEKKPPPPTTPLTGTQWELTSIVSGGEVRPVIEGIVITAAFQEGFMNGGSGCNSYGGEYSLDGSGFTIGEIEQTAQLCLDEELMEQETMFIDILQEATEYQLTDEILEIGHLGAELRFQRADS